VLVPPNGTYAMLIVFRTDRTPSSDQGEEMAPDAFVIELTPTAWQLKRPLRVPGAGGGREAVGALVGPGTARPERWRTATRAWYWSV
jgi:hypothetical protein